MRQYFFLVLITFIAFLQDKVFSAIVETSLGQIQGSTMTSQYGVEINAFRGIPYAESPVGDLRFRPPVPVQPWDNILKATRDLLVCPQPGLQIFMTEDCLTLNVFSRNLTGRAPVIVYIHGGANVLGSGNSQYEAGPQYLLDHDVVFVAFNYRLGALGFLSTRTEEAPGNYGYLDQVLALKWVQEHIAKFGGDPNLVTIFGLSAGSMAVTLHMASPLSRGLFHRAIAMSGSATNHFSIDNLVWTRKLAREASCPMYNPSDLVDCLRKVSWGDIVTICARWEPYGFTNMKWNYEIDQNFLHMHPTTSFVLGNISEVPLLAGITKNELDFSLYHLEDNTGLLNDISVNFNKYAPEMFLYDDSNDDSEPLKSTQIQEFYFGGNKPINGTNLEKLGEAFSDAIIGHGVHRLVSLASQYIDVYYYRMDYVGLRSIYTDIDGNPRGVGHADDLRYVMPGLWYGPQIKPDNVDMFMVNRTTKLWTSFAKTGVPQADGIEWLPTNSTNVITLYNSNDTYMSEAPYQNRYAFWDQLFPVGVSEANAKTISRLTLLITLFLVKFLV